MEPVTSKKGLVRKNEESESSDVKKQKVNADKKDVFPIFKMAAKKQGNFIFN